MFIIDNSLSKYTLIFLYNCYFCIYTNNKAIMTIQDLYNKCCDSLDARPLKKPGIRKNALNKVLVYLRTSPFFQDGHLSLPLDKERVKEGYKKYKDKELNDAENSVINLIYKISEPNNTQRHQSCQVSKRQAREVEATDDQHNYTLFEKDLVKGNFLSVNAIDSSQIPQTPGLYCIKIRKGVRFPHNYGKIRDDGIIYIGKASKSLRSRLWEEELKHKRPATFFRSIGAMLGFLPPIDYLYGRTSRNYKFCDSDECQIRKWMDCSLFVNFIQVEPDKLGSIEKAFIRNYAPLVNIQHNPNASDYIKAARKRCVDHAKRKI